MANVQVEVELNPDGAVHFAKIKEMLGLKTDQEVFDYAIIFFAWVVSQAVEGKPVGALDVERKTFSEVKSPILEKIAGLRGLT